MLTCISTRLPGCSFNNKNKIFKKKKSRSQTTPSHDLNQSDKRHKTGRFQFMSSHSVALCPPRPTLSKILSILPLRLNSQSPTHHRTSIPSTHCYNATVAKTSYIIANGSNRFWMAGLNTLTICFDGHHIKDVSFGILSQNDAQQCNGMRVWLARYFKH